MNNLKTVISGAVACHTCRRQRRRCDATKPSCRKCEKRGVECLGYGQQPILWVQPRIKTGNPPVEELPKRGKGRPKLVLMTHTLEGKCQDETDGASVSISTELLPVGYQQDMLAFSSFQYFNTSMVTDMVIIDSPKNPHRSDPAYWQYIPELLRDMVIASALTHQVLRCQSSQDSFPPAHQMININRNRMASWQNPSMATIYKHQRNVLHTMGELIVDTELRYSDIVLGVIIGLIRVEIQQSAFGAWNSHLNAARIIISKRGGFKRLVQSEHVFMEQALTTYMLVDVMSAVFTTSRSLDAKCVTAQLEYIQLLDIDFKHGRDCDFPCGNQLLEAIIRINHMRLISRTSSDVKADLNTSCDQIFCRIGSFDPAAHSRVLLQELLPCFSSASEKSQGVGGWKEHRNQTLHDMCEELGRAYKYSVMLYCFRTLYMDRGKLVTNTFKSTAATSLIAKGSIGIDIERPHESTLECLLESLHRLWDKEKYGPDWVGKYTFWPLWVAGMEINPNDGVVAEQKFVCESLQRLCYHLGDLGPLDAVSALQLVWTKRAPGDDASWDDKLAMPGVQGIFFV